MSVRHTRFSDQSLGKDSAEALVNDLRMQEKIEKYRDLLESKELIVMATINNDGSPQTSPVWFIYRDGLIEVNTAVARKKDRNLKARPVFSGTILDPNNPYRYVEVRGKVVESTEEGGDAHIDFLAQRYMGVDVYPYHLPEETRIIYKIQPTHVAGKG